MEPEDSLGTILSETYRTESFIRKDITIILWNRNIHLERYSSNFMETEDSLREIFAESYGTGRSI
jgi:hypothetical protein